MVELYKGKQRFQRSLHSGDIAFNQQLNNVTDKEDVPNFGDWTEKELSGDIETGNGKPLKFAGTQNRFWGTNAALLGAKIGNLTVRGKRADTTRQEKTKVYLE